LNKNSHYPVKAKFIEYSLAGYQPSDDTVVVPVVKGSVYLKYGKHSYYFYNFKTLTCLCVEISHWDIIKPGLSLLLKALHKKSSIVSIVTLLFKKYHYGFSVMEQIMLMTVPHAVTSLGGGKFLVNLWSYIGFLEIDCTNRSVIYMRADGQDPDHVLGSQQWLHHATNDIYYTTYNLSESFKRIADPHFPVSARVIKRHLVSKATETVWNGALSDYLHDVLVNKTGEYCVVCELGMFQNKSNETIPSKVLIIDLQQNKQWIINKFIVAAHAQFDPTEPDIIYFSQHNFKFIHTSLRTLLRKAIYSLEFTGPASVYKYKLTPVGPQEIGVFTMPDMFRLTNFHIFLHRGKKMLAAMGFPNFIFLADAETMVFIKKITVTNPISYKYLFKNVPCFIGTFSPSSNGEHLYVQTTRSFQIIDIGSGKALHSTPLFFNHTAANHMQTSHDVEW